jgi:hypothetical protein
MRDVRIITWCDLCFDQDPDGPQQPAEHAATACIVVDGAGKPVLRTLDLCETHAKELAGLAATILKMGAPLDRSAQAIDTTNRPPSARPMPCPVCHTEMTKGYVPLHIWSVHIGQTRPPQPTTCPECGLVSVDNANPVQISRHRAAMHDFDPVAEAIAVYEDGLNRAATPRRSTTHRTTSRKAAAS